MSQAETKTTAGYADGFVIVVPKSNLDRYRETAETASTVWKEYGAIDYFETVGDDLGSEFGKPFPALTESGPDDAVVFSWITYRDRAHRDEVNAKVMADERMKAMCPEENSDVEPPFDMARFSYGGFSVLVKG